MCCYQKMWTAKLLKLEWHLGGTQGYPVGQRNNALNYFLTVCMQPCMLLQHTMPRHLNKKCTLHLTQTTHKLPHPPSSASPIPCYPHTTKCPPPCQLDVCKSSEFHDNIVSSGISSQYKQGNQLPYLLHPLSGKSGCHQPFP